MAFVLGDLKGPVPGSSNMGGVMSKAHIIPVADLDLTTTPLVLSAVGKLDFAGPIVPKAGKHSIEVYSTPEKNSLDDNSVGEVDGISKENSYMFFYPGDEQAVTEFEAYILNTPVVIIVPTTNGKKRALGLIAPDWLNSTAINADIQAHLTEAKGTSGTKRADLKGKSFKFTHSAPHAPLYYTGPVPIVE